jgi:hypothetical protein
MVDPGGGLVHASFQNAARPNALAEWQELMQGRSRGSHSALDREVRVMQPPPCCQLHRTNAAALTLQRNQVGPVPQKGYAVPQEDLDIPARMSDDYQEIPLENATARFRESSCNFESSQQAGAITMQMLLFGSGDFDGCI